MGAATSSRPASTSAPSSTTCRESSDDSNEPSEAAFNPQSTWRRGGSSWHLGCGQRDFDLEDKIDQRSRFRSSLNVDVWTRQEARPLPRFDVRGYGPAVARPVGAAMLSTNGWYAAMGGRTYRTVRLGLPGPLTVAGEVHEVPATHIVQMGDRIYFRFTDNSLGRVTVGTAAPLTVSTAAEPKPAAGIGAAIGRLFGWDVNGSLYEISADDVPHLVMTHPWAGAGWAWRGVCDTPSGGLA